MLSSHLRLGLPSGLFPSGFPTKTSPLPYKCNFCKKNVEVWYERLFSLYGEKLDIVDVFIFLCYCTSVSSYKSH
jgi:hypothetical protein